MSVQWPLSDRFMPEFSSLELRPPSLVRRAEFEDGEDRVRRTAHHRPHRMRFDLDIGKADMAMLRRWWLEETDGGRLWFRMRAFVDEDYREIEARLVDDGEGPWRARLQGDDDYRVTLTLEIRSLPRVDDAAFALRLWSARPADIGTVPNLVLSFADEYYAATE